MEQQRTFNSIVKDNDLEGLMEATRRLCNYKMHASDIKLPAYVDREDVMQEAALKVFKAYDKFDSLKASANTYFTRIIENVIRDYIRHSKNQTTSQGFSAPLDIYTSNMLETYVGNISRRENTNMIDIPNEFLRDTTDESILFSEIMLDLKDLLTEREKKIFTLKYEGYTLQEIADRLKVSRPTVAKDWLNIKKLVLELVE